MQHVISALLVIAFFSTSTRILAQETESGPSVKKLHLKKITYISANGRFGYGLSSSSLESENDWKYDGGNALLMGVGFNYVRKNNFGFDLQLNHERAKYGYKNVGPSFKTGYNTLGVEIGVKKIILTKPDDTFFFRGGFGVNFIINTKDQASNEFYSYSSNSGGIPNMYVMPELGYQLRFGSPYHIIDISVLYKYSLAPVGTTNMLFTDSGNANESNLATMSGTYLGFAIRYSYMINAFKKNPKGRSTPDSVF
ncbi:MAG: hypothetical protein ACI9N1_002094 [Flavobacteriales bacterium]|jgi:hypothetical protein